MSTLVAVQPYTWIGEDFDKESRRSDHKIIKSTVHKLNSEINILSEGSQLFFLFFFHSSDDIDHRSSHTNIAQASSVPFAPPQMPVSASMPWLGSGQTSMGASVV